MGDILLGTVIAILGGGFVFFMTNILCDFAVTDWIARKWNRAADARATARRAAAQAAHLAARRAAEDAARWEVRESVIDGPESGKDPGKRHLVVEIVRIIRYPTPTAERRNGVFGGETTVLVDEKTEKPLRIGTVAVDRDDFEIELTSVRLAAQARCAALNDRSLADT